MLIFPHFHHWHHFGCVQHTLPLLFDDCLTLLEKLDALWCKLNDLIMDYDEFKDDFLTWKDEVETTLDSIVDTLTELDSRVSTLESKVATLESTVSELQSTIATLVSDVNNIKTRLTTVEGNIANMQTTINSFGDSIDDLLARMTALENTLNNLHIVVPEELFKENDIDWFINNVSIPWLTQMGLSTSTYTPLRKIIPVATDVGTIPAVSLKVGILGFPIVQSKIPLMYSFTPGSNINSSATFLANIANDPVMGVFLRAVQTNATTADAFADITLYSAPTFSVSDNVKYEGSYAIFQQPGSTSPTVGVELYTDNTIKGIRTSNCEVGIRLVLTQGSTEAKLAIAVDKICCYYCELDNKVYIMLLSEHN